MSIAKEKSRFMPYFYSLLIILSLSTGLYSQITVTQSELMKVFAPGNALYVIPGESGLINVGNSDGPNVYDFTFIDSENAFIMNNYEVSQIPDLSGRYPSNASTFGEALQSIDGNPVFLSVTDSTFLLGDVSIGDENNFIHYDPYELFAKFPLTIGGFPPDPGQAFYVYDTTFNSGGEVIASTSYPDYVNVETYGYGTLKLPGRDLECLRMIRRYSWFQFKEFFFITKEGVLVVVSNVATTEPDTGYVEGDYVVLSSDPITAVHQGNPDIPIKFKLAKNYPNPFNPTTTIEYHIPREGHVDLGIFNILGQKVTTLVFLNQPAGIHRMIWDASDVPSGVYICRIEYENQMFLSQKIVLIK
jgi:hypothetical protein